MLPEYPSKISDVNSKGIEYAVINASDPSEKEVVKYEIQIQWQVA